MGTVPTEYIIFLMDWFLAHAQEKAGLIPWIDDRFTIIFTHWQSITIRPIAGAASTIESFIEWTQEYTISTAKITLNIFLATGWMVVKALITACPARYNGANLCWLVTVIVHEICYNFALFTTCYRAWTSQLGYIQWCDYFVVANIVTKLVPFSCIRLLRFQFAQCRIIFGIKCMVCSNPLSFVVLSQSIKSWTVFNNFNGCYSFARVATSATVACLRSTVVTFTIVVMAWSIIAIDSTWLWIWMRMRMLIWMGMWIRLWVRLLTATRAWPIDAWLRWTWT